MTRATARSFLPPAVVLLFLSSIAPAQEAPYDLRYLGRAVSWTGCREAEDPTAINPANVENNVLGFTGTPQSQRVEVEFKAELPNDVPSGTKLAATFEIACVQRPGWEPVEARAIVKYEDRGTPLTQAHYVPTEGSDLWSFSFDSQGGGSYSITVRVGGARYFHGRISTAFTLIPETGQPLTRAEWFARRLVDETKARAFAATKVWGSAPAEGRDDNLPQASDDPDKNVVHWAYAGFDRRTSGVYYPLQITSAEVGEDVRVTLLLRYPIGLGSLEIRDPETGGVLARTPVYPSPETRAVWLTQRFDKPGVYHVLFIDDGVGRAEASVYRLCYLSAEAGGR